MKKMLGALFALLMFVSIAKASDQPWEVFNSTNTTTISSATIIASDLGYIIVESTGTDAAVTISIRDGNNDASITITPPTAADTTIVDLTRTPVRFGTSILVNGSAVNTAISISIIYRKSR